MIFSIDVISIKRFLLTSLLFVPLTIGLPIVCAVIYDSKWFIVITPLLWILALYFAMRVAKKNIKLDLDEDRLIIDDVLIEVSSISGYYLNSSSLIMASIDLRLKSKETVSITCSKYGESGKEFERMSGFIIQTIMKKADSLGYQDIHDKQMKILRPIIIVGFIVVLGFDISAVYLKVTGEVDLPWQLFFLNILGFSLVPYLKRKK